MSNKNNSLRSATDYIAAIERSDYFLEATSDLRPFESTRRAYGAAALRFVDDQQEKTSYLDRDTQAVRLIGLIDKFIESSQGLNRLYAAGDAGQSIRREDKLPYIRPIVEFNHAIRELVDSQPQLTTNSILDLVAESTLLLDGDEQARFAVNEVRLILWGMQQEVVAEQALWTIDGVEDVIHASVEQELLGIDLIVVYKGREILLDIKSSQASADKANRHAQEYGDSQIAVWTGLRTSDLHHKFRAEPAQVADVADRLQAVLDTGAPYVDIAI